MVALSNHGRCSMPSQRTRMALTLPDSTAEAIKELAEAMGKPAATVVVELLRDMEPQLHGLAKLARASRSGSKAAATKALQNLVGGAMADVVAELQPDMFSKARKPAR